jgi:hypothetical protein
MHEAGRGTDPAAGLPIPAFLSPPSRLAVQPFARNLSRWCLRSFATLGAMATRQ